MNCINLVGRVMADPELRFLENGSQLAAVSISVDRSNGKKNERGYRESDVFRCKVWGKRAETLNEYAKKGSIIAVTGRLEMKKAEDGKGYWVEVADAQWSFVPRSTGEGGGQAAPSYDEASELPF